MNDQMTIFLKKITAAIENQDTVDTLLNTKVITQQVERHFGYTTTSNNFVKACQSVQ